MIYIEREIEERLGAIFLQYKIKCSTVLRSILQSYYIDLDLLTFFLSLQACCGRTFVYRKFVTKMFGRNRPVEAKKCM